MTRTHLPNRRPAELINFWHNNRRWGLAFGHLPDGRVGEIFIDAPKVDPLAELVQQMAIVASLALQHGCPLATLRHALGERGQGPLGAALALIDADAAQ